MGPVTQAKGLDPEHGRMVAKLFSRFPARNRMVANVFSRFPAIIPAIILVLPIIPAIILLASTPMLKLSGSRTKVIDELKCRTPPNGSKCFPAFPS